MRMGLECKGSVLVSCYLSKVTCIIRWSWGHCLGIVFSLYLERGRGVLCARLVREQVWYVVQVGCLVASCILGVKDEKREQGGKG